MSKMVNSDEQGKRFFLNVSVLFGRGEGRERGHPPVPSKGVGRGRGTGKGEAHMLETRQKINIFI